jgi:hypothetical protein
MDKLNYSFCDNVTKVNIALCKAELKFEAELYNLEQTLVIGDYTFC